ncbi:MAG TPA: MurR/RpiR family transcriptional regulator [Thermoanaerobaculia bacterium]|nr:MurR/RpiR family transcriptional regulator [Thermoanaerobaculia bacterium]
MQELRSEADFRELVLGHLGELPPQQQAIAAFLLEHLGEVPFLSVPTIAQQTGASEATVVRLAQRLGFDGFSEMKGALLELVRERLAAPRAALAANGEAELLASVARLEQGNVQRLVERLSPADFRAAAAALFKADHVYLFGMGISSLLSELAAYLMTEIGLRVTALSTRFSSPREQLVALRASDLLFAFSFPPYSRQTLDLLAEAAQRGLPTVVVTDRPDAPAAASARHVLAAPTDNMLLTNAVAAVTVLLNALVTEIAVRHQGRAVDALTRINRILAEEEDVLHGTT